MPADIRDVGSDFSPQKIPWRRVHGKPPVFWPENSLTERPKAVVHGLHEPA